MLPLDSRHERAMNALDRPPQFVSLVSSGLSMSYASFQTVEYCGNSGITYVKGDNGQFYDRGWIDRELTK